MKTKALAFAAVAFALLGLSLAACITDGTGACISSPVSYSYGSRVYCYDGWDESDCDDNDSTRTNGASWTFYSGDTCEDHGLTNGSN